MTSGVSRFSFRDTELCFRVDDRADSIQSCHARGEFYEELELKKLLELVGTGKRILDIGAHVGNHTVFFGKVMQAESVIPVEPNRLAYDTLAANVRLNDLAVVDTRYLGLGLSDKVGTANAVQRYEGNLGSTFLSADAAGTIPLVPGDLLFERHDVDLIKIDVEGLETRVLAGLSNTIARSKPWIFVEVDNAKMDELLAWRARSGYAITWRHRRYPENENLLLRHP